LIRKVFDFIINLFKERYSNCKSLNINKRQINTLWEMELILNGQIHEYTCMSCLHKWTDGY
jgi:hypothetical protein